jgi:hypothetical protein
VKPPPTASPDIDEATRICARLLREGSVARAEVAVLEAPEVRREVERRLRSVGLLLATSPSSGHVGLRLAPEVAADADLDTASHLGLRAEACALLVILWVRLIFQRQRAGAAEPPRVHLETLVRDFQPVLGGRSRIRSLVQELRRLRFLAGSGEEIEAAPLLDLALDGERILGFLRRDVLAALREEPERATDLARLPAAKSPGGLGGQVLATIDRLGGTVTMGDLSRLTNAPASRLRRILHELQNAGWVRRTGERAGTRYHLARRPAEKG